MNDIIGQGAQQELASSDLDTIRAALDKVRAAGYAGRAGIGLQRRWELSVSSGEIDASSSSTTRGMELEIIDPEGRRSIVSSNRFGRDELMALTDEGLALCAAGEPDPWRALPPLDSCGVAEVEGLEDSLSEGFEARADALAKILMQGDQAVRSADPRIAATHRAQAAQVRGTSMLLTTDGLEQSTRHSMHSVVLNAVARDGEEKQTAHQWTVARAFAGLRDIEAVAEETAQRALRGFGWQQAPSGAVRVLFDPEMASRLLGVVARLAAGSEIYSKRSIWADALDTQVMASGIDIRDEPTLSQGIGSRAYDGEGVISAPCTLVRDGRLQTFLTDDYSARRLERPRTGHASGVSNLRLAPGEHSKEAMFDALGTGLWLTQLHGHGVDIAAGTWSMGAAGFWVQDGGIVHPVQEITLAGKLAEMFAGIEAVGNDAREDASISSPSLLIGTGLVLGGS